MGITVTASRSRAGRARTCARGVSTSVYARDPDDNLVELTVYDDARR